MILAKPFSQNEPFLTKWTILSWQVTDLGLVVDVAFVFLSTFSPHGNVEQGALPQLRAVPLPAAQGRRQRQTWNPEFPELRPKIDLSVCICLHGQCLLLTHVSRGCFLPPAVVAVCGSCDVFSCTHFGFFISVSFNYSPLSLSDQIGSQLTMKCQWQITAFCFQQCLSLLASLWKRN